jgi:hypothetical protein
MQVNMREKYIAKRNINKTKHKMQKMVASTKEPDLIGYPYQRQGELLILCLPKIYELSINPKNV